MNAKMKDNGVLFSFLTCRSLTLRNLKLSLRNNNKQCENAIVGDIGLGIFYNPDLHQNPFFWHFYHNKLSFL